MRSKTFSALFVVQGKPPPEREADYHRWYDTMHGPDALAYGSFREMRRYRAIGPGDANTPYLALWNGDYVNEAEAWGHIRPLAEKMRVAGRLDDIASVKFALMMFSVPPNGVCTPSVATPTLTTVQNDWRHSDEASSADAWWDSIGLDDAPCAEAARLYTSDSAGKGAGCHLALFEQSWTVSEAAARWRGIGTPGLSPTPPYQVMFKEPAAAAEPSSDGTARASAWVMHWELITAVP